MAQATFIIMSLLFSLIFMALGAVWDGGLLFILGVWLGFLSIAGLILWSGDYTCKVIIEILLREERKEKKNA